MKRGLIFLLVLIISLASVAVNALFVPPIPQDSIGKPCINDAQCSSYLGLPRYCDAGTCAPVDGRLGAPCGGSLPGCTPACDSSCGSCLTCFDTLSDAGYRCLPPINHCTTNNDCSSTKYCKNCYCSNFDSNFQCKTDSDCGSATKYCQDNICYDFYSGYECRNDADCNDPNKYCATEILSFKVNCGWMPFCMPLSFVVQNKCETKCTSNVDCGWKHGICDTATGECLSGCKAGFDYVKTDSSYTCTCNSNSDCNYGACNGGLCELECDQSFQCGMGEICSNGACIQGCDTNAKCTVDMACKNKVCVPAECTSNNDCEYPTPRCVNKLCNAGCDITAECDGKICYTDEHRCVSCTEKTGKYPCPNGYNCDGDTGKCSATSDCTKEGCAANTRCDPGTKSCTSYPECPACPAGKTCDKNTFSCISISAGGCTTNKDCNGGLCVEGECKPSCIDNCGFKEDGNTCLLDVADCEGNVECEKCAVNELCVTTNGKTSCVPGLCTKDSDCITPAVCDTNANQCVLPQQKIGCSSDNDCTDASKPVCNLVTKFCEASSQQAYCDDETPCNEGYICQQGGECVKSSEESCSSDNDCSNEQICYSGSCVVPSPCSVNTDCPNGQVCTNGLCIAPVVPASNACDNDLQCPGAPEAICENGECNSKTSQPDCTSGAGCPTGFVCDEINGRNRCVSPLYRNPCPTVSFSCDAISTTECIKGSTKVPLQGSCCCIPEKGKTDAGLISEEYVAAQNSEVFVIREQCVNGKREIKYCADKNNNNEVSECTPADSEPCDDITRKGATTDIPFFNISAGVIAVLIIILFYLLLRSRKIAKNRGKARKKRK